MDLCLRLRNGNACREARAFCPARWAGDGLVTKSTAEKITGLRIKQSGLHFYGFDGDGQQVVDAVALTEREALNELVQKNWARVSRLCFERDGWQCRLCGGLKSLNAHHVVYRSHGRRDTLDNLATICQDPMRGCHDEVHKHKKKVPEKPWGA